MHITIETRIRMRVTFRHFLFSFFSVHIGMLHAVRQFSRARGLHIEIGAVSIGTSGVDPRALMLYLRDLDVKFFVDQISK